MDNVGKYLYVILEWYHELPQERMNYNHDDNEIWNDAKFNDFTKW